MSNNHAEFFTLKGKTLVSITGLPDIHFPDFVDSDGDKYSFIHHQDCCESVNLYKTIGNIDDINWFAYNFG